MAATQQQPPRAGTPGRPLLAIYMHLDFQMLLI